MHPLVRIVVFLAALLLALLILRPLLAVLISVSFWLVRTILIIAIIFLIVHVFLKFVFRIDLFEKITNFFR